MHKYSREIADKFPVRKSKKQKSAFRKRIAEILKENGYCVTEQKGGIFSSVNLIAGDVKQAKVIFTAHYDTCAVLPVPNFIAPLNLPLFILYQVFLTAIILLVPAAAAVMGTIFFHLKIGMLCAYVLCIVMILLMLFGKANKSNANDNTSGVVALLEAMLALPAEQRSKVAFVFFDNEEAGLLGSSAFASKYKNEIADSTIINLDCVADGQHFLLFPSKKLERDLGFMDNIRSSVSGKEFEFKIIKASRGIYPSDQINFKKSCAIAAFHKSKGLGYWLGRIHTGRDTVMEESNIIFLRDFMINLSKII